MPDISLTKAWTYLASTTFERIAPFVADNVTSRIFLLHHLEQSGMKQHVRGGLSLNFPIFKELPAGQSYSDLGTLGTARASPTTIAQYDWKQIAVPVTISGRDMVINSGSDMAVTQVLQHFIEAAEAECRETLDDATDGIHSSNGDAATGITGLQALITHTSNATPTSGTVGSVNRATITQWRNQVADVANDFSANGYFRMIRKDACLLPTWMLN